MRLSASIGHDRRVAGKYHWPLILTVVAILTIGMFNLYSAASAGRPAVFYSQLIWAAIAIGAGFITYAIDYRIYERLAYLFYGALIVMLIAVLFTRPIAGSHRWLSLGMFSLQPSELMKLGLVVALAKYYHDNVADPRGYKLWQLRKVTGIVLAPVILVILEPDLGTSMLLAAIAFTIMLFAKIRASTLILLFVGFLILMPMSWFFVLKDYQKQRVITLFDPDSDPRGTGYHRRQSIIAVGSGQLTGKGYREGTQTQLRFLPEQHTDFIFSVWAEEQGFMGGVTLLLFYLALILSGIHISSKAREKFGALVALGVTSILFWQILINIGMVLGLLPVVGVTLPMMSYGGTSMVVTGVCIGLLMNIYARRYLF